MANENAVSLNGMEGFIVNNSDPEKTLYKAKKSGELERGVTNKKGKVLLSPSAADNLKQIISDILAGDKDAMNRPEFKSLEIPNMIKALEWLNKTNKLSDGMKARLVTEGWRMSFKYKPPTIKEFLTQYYIGEQATTLHPWIHKTLEEYFAPLSPYRSLILSSSIGTGKDQDLNSRVYLTQDDYKLMGEIQIGDKILSSDGNQTEVIAITDWDEDDVYELEMDNGKKIRCGPHHLHYVSYRQNENGEKIWEIVETLFLMEHLDYEFEFKDLS